ncbi:hypothetical protein C0993_011198, partial [Termitomyces sp. T159_Od127]
LNRLWALAIAPFEEAETDQQILYTSQISHLSDPESRSIMHISVPLSYLYASPIVSLCSLARTIKHTTLMLLWDPNPPQYLSRPATDLQDSALAPGLQSSQNHPHDRPEPGPLPDQLPRPSLAITACQCHQPPPPAASPAITAHHCPLPPQPPPLAASPGHHR